MNWKKWARRFLRISFVLFLLFNMVSAFHAWKFTHFYNDPSLRHRDMSKAGFMDKAGAIVFGISYPKSENKNQPAGKYKVINLKTADGLRIEGWLQGPAEDSVLARGTVILFHGHGGSKSSLLAEAEYFLEAGFKTLLIDFRAHGGSSGETCTIGKAEAEEVKLAADFVKAGGEKNIILYGISMGAAAITSAMDQYPDLQPQKIILEMPFASLLDAVEGRVKIMGLPEEPIGRFLTFWGGVEQGFWAFNHNPADYAKKINCPVLLQWGALDNRVKRSETEAIFRNLGSVKKEMVVYEQSGHQSLLLKEPEKWKQQVNSFIAE